MTALVSEKTIDTRFVFWSCCGVACCTPCCGPPTASLRTGPSAPWVSLPGPTWALRCPGRMASEAERQPLVECVLVNVFVFVFRTENTYTPARLEALFKSSQSSPFPSHPSWYHSYHPQLTRSDSLQSFGGLWVFSSMKSFFQQILIDMLFISFEIFLHFFCLLPAVPLSSLFTTNANLFHFEKIDQLQMLSRLSL